VNRLGVSDEKAKEYLKMSEKQVQMAIERKQAIEKRSEIYKGELQIAIDDIKDCETMLQLVKDNM
jgi:plasmid rolling circle replication initiator protein Rep